MSDQSPYAAAAEIPLIKSPSLRVPRAVALPPDIHPLPDSVNAYFVYPFTLEPHVLTTESSRRSAHAARAARTERYLRSREEERERRRRDALRRIAPGFDPDGEPLLVPTTTNAMNANVNPNRDAASVPAGRGRARDVMDELVDHLAALE